MHVVDYMDGVRVLDQPRVKTAHRRSKWLQMPTKAEVFDTALITSTITLIAALVWVKG